MAESTTTTIRMDLNRNKSHWQTICKIGQGAECCKYLVAGTTGLECMKEDPANKEVVDANWLKNQHVAQGDNCEGYGEHKQYEHTLTRRHFEDDGAYAED